MTATAPSDIRLHIITGKGGTGKTTVAGAFALALAAEGRKVLLCEVEGRQGIASLFDVAPLPYEERRIAIGEGGGEVYALAIDTEAALLEYLDMFYRLGRAGKALDRFGVIDFATTVAPGVRDVLLTGKVYEATRRGQPGRSTRGVRHAQPSYDAVVLDAPPTGRIPRFLNVNTEVAGIAKVGPIRNQATSIMRLLKSDQTRVHVVTTLEEMPVQETLDGITELRAIGLPVGAVIVNLVRDAGLAARDLKAAINGKLDTAEIETALKEVGIVPDETVVTGLLDEARDHAERVMLERAQRKRLDAAQRPMATLPYTPERVDVGTLYEFAETLRAAGVLA